MGDELLSTSYRAGLPAVLLAFGLITFSGCSASNAAPDGSGGHTSGSGGGTAGVDSAAGRSGVAGGTSGAIASQGSASGASDVSDAGAAGSASAVDGAGGISDAVGSVSSDGSVGSDSSVSSDSSASSDSSVRSDVVAPGGARANIALNKPASASSIEHVGREPGLICDGDQTTRWVGGSPMYPQWNYVDLQAAHNIDTVVVYPYMSRAYQFLLEGSLDGVSYFTLSDQRGNTVGGTNITVSFAAQRARFVRITVSGASGYAAGWTAINEMEIYEAP
jgi:F5/8 type C domain